MLYPPAPAETRGFVNVKAPAVDEGRGGGAAFGLQDGFALLLNQCIGGMDLDLRKRQRFPLGKAVEILPEENIRVGGKNRDASKEK